MVRTAEIEAGMLLRRRPNGRFGEAAPERAAVAAASRSASPTRGLVGKALSF